MKADRKLGLLEDRWLQRRFLAGSAKGLGAQIGCCCLLNAVLLLIVQGWPEHRPDDALKWFVAASLLTPALWIGGDLYDCRRRHYFPLLQRVARCCLRRMRRVKVKSAVIERFLHNVLFSPQMEISYRSGTAQSLRAIIEALDRLCRTAERYGSAGKHVFAANEGPVLRSLRLLGSLPAEVGDDVALITLLVWLETVPEYDPEGFSFRASAERV